MFFLRGTRKNGHSVEKSYEDESIARFEFDVTKCVASDLILLDEDKVIEEYHLEIVPDVIYKLQGKTAFNEIDSTFTEIELARKSFDTESERCDWLVLYKIEGESIEQLKIHVKKGVA
ncbi:hypothetical protein UT300009_29820 [Paraclostridium bifermentans]